MSVPATGTQEGPLPRTPNTTERTTRAEALRVPTLDRVDQEDARSTDLMPRLRGAVLESVRLWPTTPVLLRDSLRDTNWRGVELPAGAGFIAFTPYFHRDENLTPHVHEFAPQLWTEGSGDRWPGLVPFSAGPGRCPGENVVLLAATAVLSVLLRRCGFDVRAR